MDFAELHRRILEAQKGEPALTEVQSRDTMEETAKEVPYYERRAEEERTARQESKSTFVGESDKSIFGLFESGETAFRYRRSLRGEPSQSAQTLQGELKVLGIPSILTDGTIEWNRDGVTRTTSILEATTIAKKLVAINESLSMDPKNTAGHEAYHFWGGTEARAAFEDILGDQLVYTSEAFQEYQDVIAKNYFGEEADLSDMDQVKRFSEELFAYLAGDLHSGTHEAQLRAMFQDYDAVKAAWDTLTEYGRTHPAEAPLSDSRAAPALTETQGRDTMGETVKEAPYYERRAEEERTARPETVGDFIERSRQEALSTRKIGDTLYGFRLSLRGELSQPAQTLQGELTALGIPCILTDGAIEWNRDSVTRTTKVSEAATIAKSLVAISDKFSMNPKNAAGHEAYHFWGGTEVRTVFEDVLWDQIIYTSEAFQDYQNTVATKYFGEDIDLSDSVKQERFTEELAAYIAGDLHSGTNEAQLRAMFRDYDAVKAAWDALTEYGRTHPAEAPPIGEDGLGAADAGGVNTPFDQMQAKPRQPRRGSACHPGTGPRSRRGPRGEPRHWAEHPQAGLHHP